MKNKILIPLVIGCGLAAFFSFKYINTDDSNASKQQLIQQALMKAISEGHYSPRPVDDSFSARVFTKMLESIDYDKRMFTLKEYQELEKYKYQLDDEIKENTFQFFDLLNGMFKKSIDRSESYYKELLKQPVSFTANETIDLKGSNLKYAASEKELKDRWRLFLKFRVLAKYVELKDQQDKKDVDDEEIEDEDGNPIVREPVADTAKKKTDVELEVAARESVQKNMVALFKRLRKIDDNMLFSTYINSISTNEDPHTDYLPVKEKKRFDEQMSGTFYGIGAQLKEEDGKIKVAQVIPGSPCWKQGELKAGDEIQKVGQGAAEPTDIQGMEIDDAVQLIRGKKGTEVRLTVKKVDGSIKVIPITRGEVSLEEVFAKSVIINSPAGAIGYIYLPEFYSDFQGINGRRSAVDVGKEIEKLKKENVKGIILDLRYNGGGSLSDVVDMSGMFIDNGPVVQVKAKSGAPVVLSDEQSGTLYDGPLAIMVNQGSASASEILAAAMQDYKRAIVVGTSTFGKGTVQKIVPLDAFINPMTRIKRMSEEGSADEKSLGSLKITIQKFYRVNGGSTQLKGVTPDVVLPDMYALIDMGERKDKAALPWDEIPAASYLTVRNKVNTRELAEKSIARVKANETFALINQSAVRIKKQDEQNTYTLTEAAYRQELEAANAISKKLKEAEKKTPALNIRNVQEDLARINMDSVSINKNTRWIKNLKKDVYLSETVNIVGDLIAMTPSVTTTNSVTIEKSGRNKR